MRSREIWAAALTIAIGVPLIFLMARALADGMVRGDNAAVASLVGSESWEKLRSGEKTSQHYWGDEYLAPDFTLEDKNGQPWTLSDHRGKVIVLNFWSITCPPCVREMPTLEELAKMAEDWDDVEVVAVSTDSGWQEVATVMPQDPSIRVLFDPDKRVVRGEFGTELYPETWIIDERGVIRFRYDGSLDWSSPLAVDLIQSFR